VTIPRPAFDITNQDHVMRFFAGSSTASLRIVLRVIQHILTLRGETP
jgi:hypothetical protein